jgi:putative ABC transport system ATP-binding protein
LTNPPGYEPPEGPGEDVLLSATRITKTLGGSTVLNGIDLTIRRGDSVAVLGPSGSGKTTLLYCLAGLLTPTTGDVVAAGTSLTHLDEVRRARLRRREFGFVFQTGLLVPDLSAVENVALPLLLDRVSRNEALRRATDVLDQVGMAAFTERLPGDLSGGEAQRVCIARAVVAQPSVVFADEPTGNLDSANAANVADLLMKAVVEGHTALLLVTHDLALAERLDSVLHMQDGRLTGQRLES